MQDSPGNLLNAARSPGIVRGFFVSGTANAQRREGRHQVCGEATGEGLAGTVTA